MIRASAANLTQSLRDYARREQRAPSDSELPRLQDVIAAQAEALHGAARQASDSKWRGFAPIESSQAPQALIVLRDARSAVRELFPHTAGKVDGAIRALEQASRVLSPT